MTSVVRRNLGPADRFFVGSANCRHFRIMQILEIWAIDGFNLQDTAYHDGAWAETTLRELQRTVQEVYRIHPFTIQKSISMKALRRRKIKKQRVLT